MFFAGFSTFLTHDNGCRQRVYSIICPVFFYKNSSIFNIFFC
ncbi:hypothetical protein ROSINTL182_06493 [Roseburia intestinalis L1-82]|uniref:Uncharacterized protein n=1 Tax=Roseburia intestinalis L1-82 TaxID=536231 RepID=C7G9B4_9FIRM|nr:hypothetical protein ROSINTL182_06493 [Roseburia intestinalis L1-82]